MTNKEKKYLDYIDERVYHCYPELTIIKIISYAYDKFGIDELKRYNKYGHLKENNISKAIREFLPILGHEVIIKLIDKSNNKKEFIKELAEVIKEKKNEIKIKEIEIYEKIIISNFNNFINYYNFCIS